MDGGLSKVKSILNYLDTVYTYINMTKVSFKVKDIVRSLFLRQILLKSKILRISTQINEGVWSCAILHSDHMITPDFLRFIMTITKMVVS